MTSNNQDIIDEIKTSNPATIYSSFRNLFSILKPAFCKFTLTPGHKFLFRVRCHTKGNGEYFFNNLSDLSYRTDYLNIKKFGRCNQPFQSLFYCSDEEMLSFAEKQKIVGAAIDPSRKLSAAQRLRLQIAEQSRDRW